MEARTRKVSAPGRTRSAPGSASAQRGGGPRLERQQAVERLRREPSCRIMHVVRDPLEATDLPTGAVATIGNFDGVHLGHQKILASVVERARERDRPAIAITFDPHPLKVLHPELAPKMIQTLPQREEMIESLGIDALLAIPFTRDFSLTEPEDFVDGFLRRRLAVSEILLGSHFAFGRGKRGNLELLRNLGA